jgi:hypothetical protein
LLTEVRDWKELTELINSHGIIALAAYNIKESGLEKQIPEESITILENGYMQSVVRNAWLTERWKEVNSILGNAGIKHIVLKGMALEHTLYGARGLRQMSDNDIFLRREDSLKAWYLLQQEGFSSEIIKSGIHKKILLDIGKHLPTLTKNGYSVEIHHKLSDNIIIGENGSCDPFVDAIEINIGDTKAWTLSKDLQLKYLISHFEKHKMEGNCQLRLYADIVLLDKTSQVTVPDHFILNPRQEMNLRYRKAAYRSTILEIPARHRLRFVIGDIFPSLKWMKERYKCDRAKALLYYPVRIVKIFWLR